MDNYKKEIHELDKDTCIEITVYDEPKPIGSLANISFHSQVLVYENDTENIIEAFFREKQITDNEIKSLIHEYKESIREKKEECRKTGFYQGNKKTFKGL